MLRDREISMDVAFDVTGILDRMLEELDDNEMVDAIKYIDAEVADIDFTKQLYDYFAEQVRLDADDSDVDSDIAFDIVTTVSIIVNIIKASNNNKAVIDGILDYIHEIEDNN